MTKTPQLMGSAALGLVLLAGPAAADLTAEDVWSDWRGYFEGLGYVVSAEERMAGDTLAVTDIAIGITGGAEMPDIALGLDALLFTENGDGTVEVVMPDEMPITMSSTGGVGADDVAFTLYYAQSGHSMVVSGTPEALRYDYTAESFDLSLGEMTVDGVTYGDDQMRFAMGGLNLESQNDVTVGETRQYVQSFSAEAFTVELFTTAPDTGETVKLDSVSDILLFEGDSAVPVEMVGSAGDMAALMAAGFAVDGLFRAVGYETTVELTTEDGTTQLKFASESSEAGVAMGPDGILYDISAEGSQVGAQLAGLPLPLYAEMAQSGFALQVPLMKSEIAQDFGLAFDVTDLTLSDVIWGLFDPQRQLPRDPVTVALDLTGKARVLMDFMNPATATQINPGDTPGEVERLTLNALTVDALGALLQAEGDVTLDNDDRTTLPGFPKPVGDINIALTGANALLDKLMAMGLVPADQAMGARMMIGMFTVPGAEPDTLTSTIEFNEQGQILANGQRIK